MTKGLSRYAASRRAAQRSHNSRMPQIDRTRTIRRMSADQRLNPPWLDIARGTARTLRARIGAAETPAAPQAREPAEPLI